MTDVSELLHSAFPEPPEFDAEQFLSQREPNQRHGRSFAIGLLVVIVAALVTTAVVRDGQGPSSTIRRYHGRPPTEPRDEWPQHWTRAKSGSTDGVSWQVFRGLLPGNECFWVDTSPPVRFPLGGDLKPEFCAGTAVDRFDSGFDALQVRNLALPNRGRLLYGYVHTGVERLTVEYASGRNAKYTVHNNTVVLGTPRKDPITAIHGNFSGRSFRCTRSAPNGQYFCIDGSAVLLPDPVPSDSAPPTTPSLFTGSETGGDGPVTMADTVTHASVRLRADVLSTIANRLAAQGPPGTSAGFHLAAGELVATFTRTTQWEVTLPDGTKMEKAFEGTIVATRSDPVDLAVVP